MKRNPLRWPPVLLGVLPYLAFAAVIGMQELSMRGVRITWPIDLVLFVTLASTAYLGPPIAMAISAWNLWNGRRELASAFCIAISLPLAFGLFFGLALVSNYRRQFGAP